MYRFKKQIWLTTALLLTLTSCGGGGGGGGEETTSTILNNETSQNGSSCNQNVNDYPCLKVGTYTTSDHGGSTGYYKLVMPSGGGNIITDAMNSSYSRVFTADLDAYEVNPGSDNSNQLPFITSTYLPEGEYIIQVTENGGTSSRFSVNSTGIMDQSLLDSLEVGAYTSADTDGLTGYYKLIMPAGGGNIIANGINESYALVYTFNLDEYEVNPDPDNFNRLLNNISTYLTEGEYVIAVTTKSGSLSSISFAF
jgi:hypothetical protein